MYSLDELNDLLTQSVKTVFTRNTNVFTQLEGQTEIFVRNNVSVDLTEKPDWLKLPYTWILEYLALSQLTNLSDDLSNTIRTHYKDALSMLGRKGNTGSNVTPGVGVIGGMLEV